MWRRADTVICSAAGAGFTRAAKMPPALRKIQNREHSRQTPSREFRCHLRRSEVY